MMSEKFTASNGVRVTVDDEKVVVDTPVGADPFAPVRGAVAALREFFLHERDQELGRWRWPENQDYVVYLSEGGEAVWVLNEREAGMLSFTREMSTPTGEDEAGYNGAARAYFAAHPEPKPWHDAKPGEVWVLTVSGRDVAGAVDRDMEVHDGERNDWIHLKAIDITAARRIWPEGE